MPVTTSGFPPVSPEAKGQQTDCRKWGRRDRWTLCNLWADPLAPVGRTDGPGAAARACGAAGDSAAPGAAGPLVGLRVGHTGGQEDCIPTFP